MNELKLATKVLEIAQDLGNGVETSRQEILEKVGHARCKQIKDQLTARKGTGIYAKLTEEEAELQLDIIATLDQMSRRMLHALPKEQTDHVSDLIEKLDKTRTTKARFPVSPVLSIWRGSIEMRCHNFTKACIQFNIALEILIPVIDSSPSVRPTIVTAHCEAAYCYAMLGKVKQSKWHSEEAIKIARQIKTEPEFFNGILSDFFVAGSLVTLPLPTAYLTACDIRINLTKKWNPKSKNATDFDSYWNLLNDVCGGLTALQTPYLIAILSDDKWRSLRPDLAAPIARALYLTTADNIPHALWRRSNLFFGEFRLKAGPRGVTKNITPRVAAAMIAIFVIGFSALDPASAAPMSMVDLSMLTPEQMSGFVGGDYTDVPSGDQIVEMLGSDGGEPINLQGLENFIASESPSFIELNDPFDIASGSSSMVGGDLV